MWNLAGREHHSEAKPARTSNPNASPIGECYGFEMISLVGSKLLQCSLFADVVTDDRVSTCREAEQSSIDTPSPAIQLLIKFNKWPPLSSMGKGTTESWRWRSTKTHLQRRKSLQEEHNTLWMERQSTSCRPQTITYEQLTWSMVSKTSKTNADGESFGSEKLHPNSRRTRMLEKPLPPMPLIPLEWTMRESKHRP